jgi:ABC-type transport system substrate-binding protein
MAEAGFGNGFSLQLKHFTARAEFAPIAQLIAANLAELNIKVEIFALQIGIWLNQVLVERDFQIALSGIIPRHDPDIMLGEQYSTRRSSGKAINWRHELFERQIDQGRAVVNQEARKRVYLHAQLIAQWESAGFVLNERPILMGAAPSVQGFKPDVRQLIRFEEVWLKR